MRLCRILQILNFLGCYLVYILFIPCTTCIYYISSYTYSYTYTHMQHIPLYHFDKSLWKKKSMIGFWTFSIFRCMRLADLIWSNRHQLKKMELLRSQLPINLPADRNDYIPELNKSITGLLSSLVTKWVQIFNLSFLLHG